ncbi:MAG: AMP-binding protein [Eubacteriales bacterium]
MSTVKAPWLNSLGELPATLDYPEGSLWEPLAATAASYPNYTAYNFLGSKTTYAQLLTEVQACAKALKALGIKQDDKVTICMPNCPQTVVFFYAVNLVGAIANMVHPLSAENEIEFYLRESGSVAALTLDQFYPKFAAIRERCPLPHLIIASIKDALSPLLKVGYMLTSGRKIKRLPADAPILTWKAFLKQGRAYAGEYRTPRTAEQPAVILYSGGTTGVTKGILLSNLNFNALAKQLVAVNPMFRAGDIMLAVMPMFHGFGLGVSIHSMLANGANCILVPRFTVESYAKLLIKHRCNYIAGVPTLYEALLREPSMNGVNLSCLKGVFSGGDSLSVELKKRFDKFLADHHATVQVREGYGTTECVTASCLTPLHWTKEGSIGLPFPDTYYKIVKTGTTDELPYDEEGEICIAGPTVMMGYLNHPEETAQTLRRHDDGMLWVHTGDLGKMDADGFIYFRQRIKRMIITSGYNVYPSQIENILDAHEFVHLSCVIGVKDPLKMQRVKAFIVLKPGVEPSEQTRAALMAHCQKNMAKYALPCAIEFRESLPKTLVGKVAYRELEQEELAKEKVG